MAEAADKKAYNMMEPEKWFSPKCLVALACKNLRDSDAEKYKELLAAKSGFNDFTLEKSVVCAQHLSQHNGVYGGDAEYYTTFAPIMDQVIEGYHKLSLKDNVATEETYEKVTLPSLPEGAIVSTRIRTARNLKSLPFTVNMTKEQREKLESTMKTVFAGFKNEYLKGTYHPMTGMPEEDRLKFVDLHYLYINDDPTLELVGCYDDWPAGRGIFINENQEKGVFIVWVGEEDQLRIMAMAKGSDVQAVWDLFYTGVQEVHEGVKALGDDFSFDKQRGYLSSCPTNIGTGMRASVHVDLPAFPTKAAVKAYVPKTGCYIDIRGTRGEATSTEGVRRYDVSNKARLGSNCVEQINEMVNGVKALLQYQPPADDFVQASKLAMEVILAQPQFAYYKHDKTGDKEKLLKQAIEDLGSSGH